MMNAHRATALGVCLAIVGAVALLGCQQLGGAGGGSVGGSGTGTGEETGGGQTGRPTPEECLSANASGRITPAGEILFPTEGTTVGIGDVDFLWSATDRGDDNLLVTVYVSDQPNVFDSPGESEPTCAGSQTGLGRTTVNLNALGMAYWGIEITDGVNAIQRPADGMGLAFEVSDQGPGGRAGVEGVLLLCPREGLPARPVTTFQWLLGNVEPTRTQVFVSRAGQASPFDSPLRVLEVEPPTATSLAITETSALPLGVALSWGLRMETADGVLFTFEGQLGVSFLVEENVPPSGALLGPDNESVWADAAETFQLLWDADPGNCDDTLTSTVFLELLNGSAQPADLFGSPIQLDVGPGSLEVNLVGAADDLELAGGLWAWGVLADDGTDQAELPDSDDAGRLFRTFVRDTAPLFAEQPRIAQRSCAGGPLLDAIVFAAQDDNGADTVAATVTYATTEGAVFTSPTASADFSLGSGGGPVDGLVFLQSPSPGSCTQLIRGEGFYGIELNDGVNAPVRSTVRYEAPTGACCETDGTCADVPASACTGTYQGDGTTCADTECIPLGACCLADGTCTEGTPDDCTDGVYLGDATTCADAQCEVVQGACCLPSGACTEGPADECLNGVYQGDGTNCADANCPAPPITDCNGNGVDDGTDIASGNSPDCNLNGVPDECEGLIVDRYYVDADVAVPGDGLSWATAFDSLGDALIVAVEGGPDEIWVAEGTYYPTPPAGSRTSSFWLFDGLLLYGGFAGDETCLYQRDPSTNLTVLSGDFNTNGDIADNSYHVVRADNATLATVIDGFVVTEGNADGSGSDDSPDGGGMYCGSASVTVSNVLFSHNEAVGVGGGMYIGGGSPLVTLCDFVSNSGGQGDGGGGGGLFTAEGDPVVTDCLFDSNQAGWSGGGAYVIGGLPQFIGCEFRDNSVEFHGGGLGNNVGDTMVTDCIFEANKAAGNGGGIVVGAGSPTITNCLFDDNQALGGDGGGMFVFNDGSATVINSTLVGNDATAAGATGDGGGIFTDGGLIVANSIFWHNTDDGADVEAAQITAGTAGTVTIDYSCVQGLATLGGVGNIGTDPAFVAVGDYQLTAASLCINAGSNYVVGLPAADLVGAPRVQQCRVDMGAYESSFEPPVFEDCNSNGTNDDCDIFHGGSTDSDQNHVPDECPPP